MMISTQKKLNRITVSLRLMLAMVGAASAGPALCLAGDLPTTDELIAKMIEAEGGAAAKKKIKNREVKLNIDLGVGGMTAKGVAYAVRQGNSHVTLEIAGMGTIEEGVNGDVAWSLSMMTGPQIKEGSERGMALRETNFDGLLDWKRDFKKIECVGKETLDGKPYFKVELTPKEGSLITTYVDAKTYLPHRSDMKLTTPMGEFDMVIYAEDYHPVDGVQYSHKSRIEVMGQKRVLTVESIKHNVELPKDIFKLPDDIKALVAKNKADKEKT